MKNIIIGSAYPLRGGLADFNETLCRTFNKKNIQSKIISFSLQYPNFLFPGKTQYSTSPPSLDIEIKTKINSINPLTWISTARYIKEEKLDYLIIRYWLPFFAPCLGTIIRLVKRRTNIKVITIIDNIIPHEKRIGDKILTRYFIKKCDGFVVMSKAVLEDLKKFTDSSNIRFIPHPIYDIFGEKISKLDAIRYLGLKLEYKYILFFGLVRRYKGLDLLLEAMGRQKIKNLGIKLLVAGEFYENTSFYLDIIKKYNIEENVIIKDKFIPQDEVKYYFCASDIIVQPYRSATQSGITQIAYNFERPMLVTNVGGLAEIVPHLKVGYVVEPNPDSICNALVDFYENNHEAKFSKNCAIEKKRFMWENMVEGIMELLQQITNPAVGGVGIGSEMLHFVQHDKRVSS